MDTRKIRQVLIFAVLLLLSVTTATYSSFYTVVPSMSIFKPFLYCPAVWLSIKQILTFPFFYFSYSICLLFSGMLLGIFFRENKRLFLLSSMFAMLHYADIVIVEIFLGGELWVSRAIHVTGYLLILFMLVLMTFAGAALSRYVMKKIRPEKWKNTIIYKIVRFSALFIAAVTLTMLISKGLDNYAVLMLSELVGGLIVGMLLEKPSVLYGTLIGFVYAAVILAILVMIPSGMNMPIDTIFKKFLQDVIFSRDIIKILEIPVLFALGTWLAMIIRKHEQKNAEAASP